MARRAGSPATSGARRLTRGYQVLTRPAVRRAWTLRLFRSGEVLQPYNDTAEERYPEVFEFLGARLGGRPAVRALSFGCSTGEEVFSLRRHLPGARIKGMDLSRGNIADCRRKLRASGESGIAFQVGGVTAGEAPASYDAVLCMAVLRHGDLSYSTTPTCEGRITFATFELVVADLARCVAPGGYLAIDHSNFRFCDTASAADFECVLSVDKAPYNRQNPLFGRDNRRLDVPSYTDVVFAKRR